VTTNELVLAAVGCSGPVSQIFVDGFLGLGVEVRVLARNPERVAPRHPEAEIVRGSMAEPADVARVMEGVDAAFVMTPMGMRNQPGPEVEVARAVIEGAQASQVPHLVYTSVLGADRRRGVGILDAKLEIERMIEASGVPYSILRCGTYMEDIFDPNMKRLNEGTFFFPVNKNRRFMYTSQRDVPRFVVEELLKKSKALNRAFNFAAPGTWSVRDVERALSEASGIEIKAPRKFPVFYLFSALQPFFHLAGRRFSSILPLVRHFDRHGYTDAGDGVEKLFPDFRMTTLQEHLCKLWPERAAAGAGAKREGAGR
jgi:uncharacterized protein YbjT (DUF2867 family)